jgi:type III secretion protein W
MAEAHISHAIPMNLQSVKMIQKEAAEEEAMQLDGSEDLDQYLDPDISPMTIAQRFRKLDELQTHRAGRPDETESAEEEEKILGVENIDASADRFQKNNYELSSQTLKILRAQIRATDTPEEALDKVLKIYSDPALADEALDFLIETADPELLPIMRAAKDRLNTLYGREVKAGRNIGEMARQFSKEGLGSPTSLRDMYRDLTGNPREPLKLFQELTDKFRYKLLKPTLLFLLHSLGSDLKSKGPSIPPGELKRLIDETRSLQGILGIFRYFQSRMSIINRQFSAYHLMLPSRLNFEELAKIFIRILAERFVNPEKILQTAKALGISEEVAAQLVIYNQMREALRQIAPKYYRNPAHRDELLKAFITACENLEDLLEEEEEEEEEKEKKEKDEKDK